VVEAVPVKETFQGKTVWEGTVLRLGRLSQGHQSLCVVEPDRGKRQTAVLCRAAPGRYTLAI